MALSIGIAVHCDGCIAYHVYDAIATGATHAEVIETTGVTIMMGGGPAVVYGCGRPCWHGRRPTGARSESTLSSFCGV